MKEKRRAIRVLTLVFAIAMLNLGDLFMTLQYRDINMMVESNTVAAGLVYHSSPWPLIFYKIGSVGFALSVFVQLRKKKLVEVVAFSMVIIFSILIFVWQNYMDAIDDISNDKDGGHSMIQQMKGE